MRRVTIKDVAKLAGVSISTVSRVINKSPTVKESYRQKVEKAIKRLRYQPSVFAQRLAKGTTNAIGLVIPRYEGVFYSFYALELIRGIGTLCDVLRLDLLLHLTDGRGFFNLKGIGGIIFADIIGNRSQLEWVLEEEIPCMVINNIVEDLPVSCISIDNFGGAKEAVKYLISLGHKRIAHITGDLITQAATQRLQGYIRALKEADLPVREEYIYRADYSRGSARTATEVLLSHTPAPTAIFVASDSMALEVMTVAIEKNLKIPKDLSLVGFDDNPQGLYGAVALTTVRQPLIQMGQEAVKELHQLISGKKRPIRKKRLPTELIVRDSCAPLE